MPTDTNKTVWSSDEGDMRKKTTPIFVGNSLPPQSQTAYLHRDKGGRGVRLKDAGGPRPRRSR